MPLESVRTLTPKDALWLPDCVLALPMNPISKITNGDFEIGDPPAGWSLWQGGGGTGTFSRSAEQKKVGTYSAKLVRTGAEIECYQAVANHLAYASRKVTLGAWIYATVADRARLSLNDGVGFANSAWHSGVAGWEWITTTLTVAGIPTMLSAYCQIRDGDTTAYFDGAILAGEDIVHDQSGRGNHGLLSVGGSGVKPGWVLGRYNYALDFDGVGSYMNCGHPLSLNFTSEDFTIEMWINPDSLTADANLFNKGVQLQDGYFLRLFSTGMVDLYTNQAAATQETKSVTGTVITGAWQHLAVTRQGAVVKIFKNGREVSYDTQGTHIDPVSAPTTDVVVGILGDKASEPYDGLIDAIRVFNRALTAAEIEVLYAGGRLAPAR